MAYKIRPPGPIYRRTNLMLKRDFGEYVMENTLFKVAFPAEFHAQTAVEAAFRLHPQVVHRVARRCKLDPGLKARPVSKCQPNERETCSFTLNLDLFQT